MRTNSERGANGGTLAGGGGKGPQPKNKEGSARACRGADYPGRGTGRATGQPEVGSAAKIPSWASAAQFTAVGHLGGREVVEGLSGCQADLKPGNRCAVRTRSGKRQAGSAEPQGAAAGRGGPSGSARAQGRQLVDGRHTAEWGPVGAPPPPPTAEARKSRTLGLAETSRDRKNTGIGEQHRP